MSTIRDRKKLGPKRAKWSTKNGEYFLLRFLKVANQYKSYRSLESAAALEYITHDFCMAYNGYASNVYMV